MRRLTMHSSLSPLKCRPIMAVLADVTPSELLLAGVVRWLLDAAARYLPKTESGEDTPTFADLFSSPFLPFCLAPLSKHFPLSLFPLNFPFLFYSNHNCNMHDHLISVTTFTFVLVLIWKVSFLTRCELYSRGKLTCSQKFVFSSLPLLVWLS